MDFILGNCLLFVLKLYLIHKSPFMSALGDKNTTGYLYTEHYSVTDRKSHPAVVVAGEEMTKSLQNYYYSATNNDIVGWQMATKK